MSQAHSGASSSGLDPYANADVYVWWDLVGCPPIDRNPFTVVDNIRNAIKGKGYYGRIFIQAYSYGNLCGHPYPVKLEISKVLQFKLNDSTWLVNRFSVWALSHRPPATYLLIWDDIRCFSRAIEHLKSRGYNVVIARPCSLPKFSTFTWETFSIGVSPNVPACSSHFVVPFGRHSIFDAQRVFIHLNKDLGKKIHCSPSMKGKSTVVIIRVEETSYTSIKYASYYKEKCRKNPAIISVGTSSALNVLMCNAELAGIPFHGCHTESMAYDAIRNVQKQHNLIIVDTYICIADYDRNDVCGPKEILRWLFEEVEPDFVLFAVEPKYIADVYTWSEVEDDPEKMGIILLIDETTKNQGPEFLYRVTRRSLPIMFFQRVDKFEAGSTMGLVELVLGVCNVTVFFDEYTLNMMISYYMVLKEKLCSRHSEIANEVPTTLNELLIAACRLWFFTSDCEDCSRNIHATYPEARSLKALQRETTFVRVVELTPGKEGHNVRVTVVSAKVMLEKDAAPSAHLPNSRIAECLVGDETGVILFTARNEQVDVMQPRTTVLLRNAKMDMVDGFLRLFVDEWGLIEVTQPTQYTIKENNNLSLV